MAPCLCMIVYCIIYALSVDFSGVCSDVHSHTVSVSFLSGMLLKDGSLHLVLRQPCW